MTRKRGGTRTESLFRRERERYAERERGREREKERADTISRGNLQKISRFCNFLIKQGFKL